MYNDSELIYQVKENNIDFEYLLEKYKPLILRFSKKYSYLKKSGLEFEDIYQIASLTLYEAINKFDFGLNTKFSSFYNNLLSNKIKNEIRKVFEDKYLANKESISLETDKYNLLEIIPNNYNELDYIFELDYYEKINEIKKDLTFNEVCIIDLYLEGFKAKEIQSFIEEDYSHIRRTISKLKGFDFTHTV